MRGIPESRLVPLRRGSRLFLLAVAFGLFPGSGRSQDLVLPVPEFTVRPGHERFELEWLEIPINEGRLVKIDSLAGWDDSSSAVEILGEYIGECDFRVNIQRAPQDNAQGVNFRLITRLSDTELEIGSPLAIDTLNIFQPGVAYPLDPAIAPNTSIRFSPNVNPPSSPMGTIPVTTGGLNTSLNRSSTYFVTPLNAVTNFPFDSDSLVVRVVGPATVNDSTVIVNPLVQTLVVRSTSEVFPVMNGMTLSFGAGSAAPGDTAHWSARYLFPAAATIRVNLEAFEGYHIWRSDLPNVDSFSLLGEIRVCESKFELALLNEEEIDESQVELEYDPNARRFLFTDLDIHNDFPYRYSVTTFDRGFLGNEFNVVFEGQRIPSEKFYPGLLQRDAARDVFVVPNPYVRRAAWEEGEAKVVFTNLPPSCTIRIFTEAADHVVTVVHGPDQPRSTSPTTVTWNLKTDGGEDLVPGVYIYYVEGSGYQTTGKMMVAR
jgi:hypothetical protein